MTMIARAHIKSSGQGLLGARSTDRRNSTTGVLLGAAIVVAGCSRQNPVAERAAPVPVVTVVEARRRDVPIVVHPIGTTRAIESVTARARVRGFLQEQKFREGSMVKKGQLLFVIEEDPFKASLDVAIGRRDEAAAALARAKQSQAPKVAQAQLDLDRASQSLARIEEARTRALLNRNSVSQAEYDKAKADLSKAEAQVESDLAKLEQAKADYDVDIRAAQATLESAEASVRQARIDLDYCRVHSPIDGRIGEAKVKVGNLVGPSSGSADATELATIQQLDPMGVDIEAPSRYLTRATRLIKAGLPVTISKAGIEGEPSSVHSGEADFIDNIINSTTSTFLIKARVANPEGVLLPGEYVKADVVVDRLNDALVVPEAAVVETQAGPTVFTVTKEGRVVVVPIKVGLVDDGLCTIASGLEDGAEVIVAGLQSVRPGMIVKAERQEAAAVTTVAPPVPKQAGPAVADRGR